MVEKTNGFLSLAHHIVHGESACTVARTCFLIGRHAAAWRPSHAGLLPFSYPPVRFHVAHHHIESHSRSASRTSSFLVPHLALHSLSNRDSRPSIFDLRPVTFDLRPAALDPSSHTRHPRGRISSLGSRDRGPTHLFLTTTPSLSHVISRAISLVSPLTLLPHLPG